jgi:putative heme-binding domain-containing protein
MGLTLGNDSDEELVSLLADPNSWWRQHAQRLLVDRNSPSSVTLLNETLKSSNAMGRLHALWTLQGLKQLRTEQIENALRDSEDGVRENAIKLAELHLSDSPALVNSLFKLKSDPAARVRFQLLSTLGSLDSEQASEIRWELLRRDIADNWVRVAALSAASNPKSLAEKVMVEMNVNVKDDRYAPLLEELVAIMIARQEGQTAPRLLDYIRKAEEQKQVVVHAAVLNGISRALQNNSSLLSFTPSQFNAIVQTFFDASSPKIRRASLGVIAAISPRVGQIPDDMLKRALRIARDRKQPEDIRTDAIDFVAVRNPVRYEGTLRKLFIPQEPLPIQLAALRAMSAIPDTRVCQYILKGWNLLTPQLQDAAVKTFLVDDKRTEILLSAIEQGKILESTISWPRRVRLMTQRNEVLRDRSRILFTKNNDADVNKEYQKALTRTGAADKGKLVFTENCSICHQVRGTGGIAIGPDLGTVHNWSPSAIMAHTLDPNLSISSGFDLWSVELNSGETIQGIIASESPAAVTLRNVGAEDKTVKRSEIKSINALNMSIMPTGLNEQISPEQMADLLAFLKDNGE